MFFLFNEIFLQNKDFYYVLIIILYVYCIMIKKQTKRTFRNLLVIFDKRARHLFYNPISTPINSALFELKLLSMSEKLMFSFAYLVIVL